jgi:acetoin utilization protein AcuB
MKSPLLIDQFMTLAPHTINSGMQLKTARQLMKKYGVRHLPVQLAGHLVGIISDRDLAVARSFDKEGFLLVDDVMTPDPYAVPPGTPLGEVVEKMATNLYGCAVIQGTDGKVRGIFTAIDGLRAISENLNIKKRKARSAKEALV